MRAIVFFVTLSFLLLGRDGNAYGGTFSKSTCSLSQLSKTHIVTASQEQAILDDAQYPEQEKEYLISDDSEDEYGRSLLAKKWRLIAGYFSIAHYQSILSYLYCCYGPVESLYTQASCKYIFQRILRI